ncbi:hypothetical protein N7478_000044 [Penicillium angulare]|uniref:uncharacterized protein n=1 Tax=Penicillium angulare TaxID=116970 RepID=UPI002541C196|nr:uncharacterized protein N7478_000044 [Penicillium angulare]KAJ5290793.1 hypothetical protein N7478_000044 [Penicillium angulare]
MLALHISLYALLATSLVFAIIELGLSGYVASVWGGTTEELSGNYYSGYYYTDVHVSTPGILDFLIFNSVWTMLVTVAAAVLSWFYTRKGAASKLNTILGIAFAVVYFITMVFWLACFADIASMLNGSTSTSDYLNAVIAFAVILWLLFVALFILAVLALCGVLVSDWVGYQPLRNTHSEKGPAAATVHEVPMSTNPVTSPSELSSRDAEGLYNQPNNQPISPSSRSNVASVELSGDSAHGHHAGYA